MTKASNIGVLSRALLAVVAIVLIVGGVTFATLQSQAAILKGNAILTATASLQLSSTGTTYSSSLDGYVFGNLVPGGQASPYNGYPVYLKNVGTTPLSLKLSVANTVSNTNAVDLSKVHVILTPTSGGAPQNITLADLIAANSTGGVALTQASHLNASQVISYTIQVSLDADAVNGSNGSIGSIDFSFGAVAVN
jgi:hypothetical protein